MKQLLIFLFMIGTVDGYAQELFVFTEPASNMATNSAGVRLTNSVMRDAHTNAVVYYFAPEIMYGISKKIMVHGQALVNNYESRFKMYGGGLYIKYRFFSEDDVHKHFRLAAFGRYGFNNAIIHQTAIDLTTKNSGFEVGIVATKLIHKLALSASVSGVHGLNNGKYLLSKDYRNAINYTLSVGKLLLPKEYENYNQTNVNFMVEFLGQINSYTREGFLDIAPSIQFIINIRVRIDAGYRFAMIKNLYRSSVQSPLVRLEYNFYNVFK